MKDKNRIWTDCAECAYKHLTAAYALATQTPLREDPNAVGTGVPIDETWMLLLARAQIAAREVLSGYLGNTDIAVGCLAAAEVLLPAESTMAEKIRGMRLEIIRGLGYTKLLREQLVPSLHVLAHLREAARELPELWHKPEYKTATNWFWDQQGRDDLASLIGWVREMYELGGKYEDKKTDAVEPAGRGASRVDGQDAPLPGGQ